MVIAKSGCTYVPAHLASAQGVLSTRRLARRMTGCYRCRCFMYPGRALWRWLFAGRTTVRDKVTAGADVLAGYHASLLYAAMAAAGESGGGDAESRFARRRRIPVELHRPCQQNK